MSFPITKVNMYMLAGVATAPLFMESFRLAMTARLEQTGCTVYSELLYPYGDWSRKLLRQLIELRHDLWTARTRQRRSIGGGRAAAAIKAGADEGWPLLIGHSGGGVAAVHAASILADEPPFQRDGPLPIPLRVVQIGSPKCPIPAWLQDSWMYAAAVNSRGTAADPVSLLGSWNGWQRSRAGLPVWRQLAPISPSCNLRLPLIGGHPDYFRASSSFLNGNGVSNLEITVQAVSDWLHSTFEQERLTPM
jgi:hypothetical protein